MVRALAPRWSLASTRTTPTSPGPCPPPSNLSRFRGRGRLHMHGRHRARGELRFLFRRYSRSYLFRSARYSQATTVLLVDSSNRSPEQNRADHECRVRRLRSRTAGPCATPFLDVAGRNLRTRSHCTRRVARELWLVLLAALQRVRSGCRAVYPRQL